MKHRKIVLHAILVGSLSWFGCAGPVRVDRSLSPSTAMRGEPTSYVLAEHPSRLGTQSARSGSRTQQLLAGGRSIVRDMGQSQSTGRSGAPRPVTRSQSSNTRQPRPRSTPIQRPPAPRSDDSTIQLASAIDDIIETSDVTIGSPEPIVVDSLTPVPMLGEQIVSSSVTPMSLQQLLDTAMSQHPQLAVRDNEVRVAQAGVMGAGVRDNPQFVFDTQTPVNESGPTQLAFRFEVPFHTASKLELRQMAAMAGVRRAAVERSIDESLIQLEVVDAASDVLYLQQLLELQTRVHQAAEQRIQLVAAEAKADESVTGRPITRQFDAEAEAWQENNRRLEIERQLTIARSALTKAVGAAPDTEYELTDAMQVEANDMLSLSEVVALAQQRSPEFAAAMAAIEEWGERHTLAFAEGVPDFRLGPRYQDELDANGTDTAGIRFSTDLPIYNKNQGEIATTAAQMDVESANAQLAEHNAGNAAAAQYRELMRLRDSWHTLRQSTESARAKYAQLLQDAGVQRVVAKSEIAAIQQQLLKYDLTDLELRYRFYRARNRLEVLLGQSMCSHEYVGAPIVDGPFVDGSVIIEESVPVSPEMHPSLPSPVMEQSIQPMNYHQQARTPAPRFPTRRPSPRQKQKQYVYDLR